VHFRHFFGATSLFRLFLDIVSKLDTSFHDNPKIY